MILMFSCNDQPREFSLFLFVIKNQMIKISMLNQ